MTLLLRLSFFISQRPTQKGYGLSYNLRPDPLVRKYLKEYGVFYPAVNYMCLADALLYGIEAAFHLGDHPACDDPFLYGVIGLFCIQRSDKPLVIIKNPLHIGQ